MPERNAEFLFENTYDRKDLGRIYERAVEFTAKNDSSLHSAADELALMMAVQAVFAEHDEVFIIKL